MTSELRLAVIPGDGIGPEVITQARKVLDAVLGVEGVTVAATEYDLGARRWHATGETLPDSVLAELRDHDAILLGAVGDPSVPSGVLERGLLLRLRFELDHAVNLRPVRSYTGGSGTGSGDRATDRLTDRPTDRATDRSTDRPIDGRLDRPIDRLIDRLIDMVVVREGTEGPYAGAGGRLRAGTPHEVATEESLNTAYGVTRVVRDAFTRAARRRGKLTLVHKTNVLVHAGALWSRVVAEVAPEFPDVAVDYAHVDAAAMYFVNAPERFDVVVTDNLFGDILTDLGAAITGGIGLAASGNLNVERTAPSMFEPVHGSAPDIAGQGVADPTAAVLSVALLLEHLGHADAAARVSRAVELRLAGFPEAGPTAAVGDELAELAARG